MDSEVAYARERNRVCNADAIAVIENPELAQEVVTNIGARSPLSERKSLSSVCGVLPQIACEVGRPRASCSTSSTPD